MNRHALVLVLSLFACPLLADVGYEPRSNALSQAGTGHGKPAVPIKILPRNVVWTQERLAEAFGPNWSSGVPGAHSPDYRGYLESQFASRTARWLNGPADSRYTINVPLARAPLGKASEWEVLYSYYTRDARVLPRAGSGSVDPTPPVIVPPSPCPAGQTCQPPLVCPACPSPATCPPVPVCPPVICPPPSPVSAPSAPLYAAISAPPESSPVDVWILPSKARFQALYFSASKLYLLRSGVGMSACSSGASAVSLPCVYAWQTIPPAPSTEAPN